jgi:hypothetical protein
MRKTISIIFGLAIVLWLALPVSTPAQEIVSLQSLAHGRGSLVVARDEYKLSRVLVVLRENGEAEFTLFTDTQLYAQGRLPASTAGQRIVSLQSLAHGRGTIVVDGDEYKISGVLVILRENGEAEFTLFTDMQLYAQGRWSAGNDLSEGIDLKITGGVGKGDAKGTGKLFLRADGKSISTLTARGTNASGEKFEVSFEAEEKNEAQP